MTVGRSTRCLATLMTLPAALAAQPARYSFDDAQAVSEKPLPGLSPGNRARRRLRSPADRCRGQHPLRGRALEHRWLSAFATERCRPKAPRSDRSKSASNSPLGHRVGPRSGCAAGAMPGPTGIRRLNRDEYAATIRDLLDIQVESPARFPPMARAAKASTTPARRCSSLRCSRKST